MIDFPANPVVGQTFQSGNIVYKCVLAVPAVWSATAAGAGVPEAPADGQQYTRGSAAWAIINRTTLGINNVDNTSDANKPVSGPQAAALEPKIVGGTATQYWRGDKTWQTLNKAAVGLDQVDNTSDVNKPASTPQKASFVQKIGDTMDGALTVRNTILPDWIELGNQRGTAISPFIDFHTTGAATDFDVRLIANANTQNTLHLAGPGQNTKLAIDGTAGGMSFSNVDASSSQVNCIAIGWRADGSVGLRVDASQFGNTWPMNITGNANYAPNSGNSNTVAGGAPDRCSAWGYASGNYSTPYMRLDNSGNIRYLVWNSNNDNTVWGLCQIGNPGYMEVQGVRGAFSTPLAASDIRLKNNVVKSTVDGTAAIKLFNMIAYDQDGEHTNVGFSAQNLQGIDPMMIYAVDQPEGTPNYDLSPILNLNTTEIIAYLAKALQESIARIDALEARQ